MARRKNPVLQKYQVEVVGRSYYVVFVKTGMRVGGPYRSRARAQEMADEFEKRSY